MTPAASLHRKKRLGKPIWLTEDLRVDEIFEHLLAAARQYRGVDAERILVEVVQGSGPRLDFRAYSRVKAGVTVCHELVEFSALDDPVRGFEAVRKSIHPAYMRVEKIGGLVRFAPAFGVEIQTARRKPAHFENTQHDVRGEIQVARELVCIPAQESVSAVGVNGTKGVGCDGHFHFVFHGVPCQSCVVGFKVEFKVFEQVIFAQEVQAGSCVGVVLVGGGFPRLGFDIKLALEADFFCMVHCHVQKRCEVVQLALHVGVQKCGVPFATAPEHVPFAAQSVGGFQSVFHLRGRIGEYVRRGRGSSAVSVTRVCEKARRAPEQLLPRLFLLAFKCGDYGIQILVSFRQGSAFRRDVAVVKAVIGDGCFLEKFEKHRHTLERVGERVGTVVPRHECGGSAKGIGEPIAHHVPVSGAKTQVFGHGFVPYFFRGVIVAEGQRIVACSAFVTNDGNIGEVAHEGLDKRVRFGFCALDETHR